MFLHLCNYYILCHIFLKKLKSFLKKFFSGHFITKKNPTSKWTFFSKNKLQFDLNVFLHLCNYYILCHIFLKKLKSFLKKKISGHFITKKKSDLKMDIFFEKENYNLILNVFLHLCYYYILCHIFLKKIKSFKKKNFSGHFITKKNPTSKWTFFSKKKITF